jgi:hypothetical protein
MKKVLPIIAVVFLLTGCGGSPDAAPPTTEETVTATTSPATADPTPEPTEEPSEEPTTSSEEDVKEALTAPTEAPDVNPVADPEEQFLEAYKTELQTLPEGPHQQLGTDEEAIHLGYQACDDLTVMSHGEALFAYAFSEATEEQVADYNAALNAAQFTLCP